MYFANFVRLSYFIFICYTHDTYVVYRKKPKDSMMTTRNLRLLFDFLPYLNVPLYKGMNLISVGSKLFHKNQVIGVLSNILHQNNKQRPMGHIPHRNIQFLYLFRNLLNLKLFKDIVKRMCIN